MKNILFFNKKDDCLTAMNSREWLVKANVGMPSNVMTRIIFSILIKKKLYVYCEQIPIMNEIKNSIPGIEHQFFDPF